MSKIIKKLTLLIILITLTFGIVTISNAANDVIKTETDVEKVFGTTMSNLPQNNTSSSTGMLPQYYKYGTYRTVTLPDTRLNIQTDEWEATINGEIVYCARRGSYVRYGKYDPAEHKLVPGDTVIQGKNIIISSDYVIKDLVATEVNKKLEAIKKEIDNNNNQGYTNDFFWKNGELVSSSESIDVGISYFGDINPDGIGVIPLGQSSEEMAINGSIAAIQNMQNYMRDIMNQLGQKVWPGKYSTDVDGNSDSGENGITGTYGPKIVVLETENQKSNGYIVSETNKQYKNDVKAYILTALENAYAGETGKLSSEYTLNDIQSAYWWALYYENPTSYKAPTGGKSTVKGLELYNKAEQYAKFIKETNQNGYKTSINQDNAKVIADSTNQCYYVGPFTITYPEYEDISYVKSLKIVSDNGTLSYGVNHNDFELILAGGGTKTSSNGISQVFPKSGEQFFVKFNANKIGDATKIKVGAQFEYINGTTLNYDKLYSQANIYQYIGYTGIKVDGNSNSQYMAKEGEVIINVSIDVANHQDGTNGTQRVHKKYIQDGYKMIDHSSVPEKYDFSCCGGEYEYIIDHSNTEKLYKSISFKICQPYIKMTEEPIEIALAQDLIVGKDGKRNYKTEYIETSDYIDLSMDLGGYVWIDENSGKENKPDGIKNENEVKVPNVTVTLYDENGNKVTNALSSDIGFKNPVKTDANGEYRFKSLNAMHKYYVQFTYNGQYYQPTHYTSPNDTQNGWNKGNWKNNSNATDKVSERLALNKKFESVGSSPNNYGTNKQTYTKEQLIESKVIDEYGNLTSAASNSMTKYVQDCLMNAYTGKDNLVQNQYVLDYYPTPDIFIIENHIPNNTRFVTSSQKISLEALYDAAYYINLGLNPREDADIAIKKDVSKVTLEINGHTHEYTYDTLENKQNAENTWEIGVRISDAYYNTEYTRELYKSDYLYKASSYGDAAKQAQLEKSKEDELQVYVTYKVMLRNQSLSIKTRINEIVDYFDKDYEYVDERSYIRIANGANSGTYKINSKANSMYGTATESSIDGYDKIYVQGLGINAQKVNDTDGNTTSTIADGIYLEGGQTAYIYLTFKVKKEVVDGEEWIKLDEDKLTGEVKEFGVGKENIVELNGYSTKYAKGTTIPNVFELDENGNEKLKDLGDTPAGLVDRDSNPGNLNPNDVPKDGTIKYDNFEDDTDKAPNIRIRLNRDDNDVRVISGSVWEDTKTKKLEVTTIGDGIKAEGETLINGVTVQLVEIMENGTEFVWREFGSDKTGPNSIGQGTGTGTKTTETPIINAYNLVKNYEFSENKDGSYAFKSFVPGKYVVRFIYGDTIRTVTPESLSLGGLNKKSYNGQDYKSTTYQPGVVQNNVYTWRQDSTWNNGKEILGQILTSVYTFKPDASNNETLNLKANQNDAQLNNKYAYLYDVLESEKVNNVSDAKDIGSRRNEVNNYSDDNVTNYISEVLASHKSDYTTMNDRRQLLNDLMQNTKMVAETGLMVVEFEKGLVESDGTVNNSYHISNVDLGLEERPKAQITMNKEVTNVKLTLADGSILFDATNTAPNVLWKDHKEYQDGYKNNLMDPDKFTSIANIREANSNKFGIVQLSMDEELMHGATIKISYKITVTNIGEVDFIDNLYYYTGVKSANAKVVTTRVDKVLDYVANNLQFYAKDNLNWKVIKADDIKSQGLVNSKLHNEIDKFNTIIITEDLAANLVPSLYKDKVDKSAQDSISVPLVLTQLITTENDGDDLTYRNIAEVVQTTNTAGRRQEFSVLGNQNPTEEPQELDTDRSEVVKILPPFGNAGIYIIIAIITILTVGILTCGILFIKKKVLKK